MNIARTQEEVDALLNDLAEAVDFGAPKWPGMSYEQGVEAGIRWLLGERDEHPYKED